MKTEITLENKAKFFAQYAGQEVLGTKRGGKDLFITGDWRIFKEDFILLKPLSSITDEDALEIAKITHWEVDPSKNTVKDKLIFLTKDQIDVADYLRFKGYALPWMGLSVEEMVQAGWAKLTR